MIDRTAWSILPACLALNLLALVGCTPMPQDVQLSVWAVSDSHRIYPDQPARKETDCYSHQDKAIRLISARNEVVACQLVLTAGTGPLENVTVAVGDLAGKITNIPTSAIRLYRPLSVRTIGTSSWRLVRGMDRAPDVRWPDGLVPLDAPRGGQPFAVPAKTSLPIWIDIAVSRKATPGPHRGIVNVLSNEFVVAQIELRVRVLPFVLPARPNLSLLAGIHMPSLLRYHLERDGKPYAPAGIMPGDSMAGRVKSILDGTCRMIHEHRCSPFLTGVYPSVSLNASSKIQVGWDVYDRTVSHYLDGTAFADRQRVAAWPLPFDRTFPPPASYGGENSPAYAAAVVGYLEQSVAHFGEKDWLAKHFVWAGLPDATKPEPSEQIKVFASLTKKADANLRLLTSAIPRSMKSFGWPSHEFDPTIADLVSIWAPPARFFDAKAMADQRALGRKTWMIPDSPPFSPSLTIGAPPVDPRALAWQAFRYKVEGILVPSVNEWTGNPLGSVQPADSQWLIYPGKSFGIDGPIPSVRLKQLRRGLQDFEYLRALRGVGQEQMADTVARALFKYGGTAAYFDHFADGCQWPWVDDPGMWDLARRLMAQQIAMAKGSPAGADQKFARSVEWRRFLDTACKLRVFCEGVRVRSTGNQDPAAGAEIELRIVVRNERPEPISGELKFGTLPVGWIPVVDGVPVDNLPCLGRAKLSLVAHSLSIATNEAGLAYIPVVFDAGSVGRIEIQARLAQLTAHKLDGPVIVDGNLSDWPPGVRNVAGDFVGVRGRDVSQSSSKMPDRPEQGTLAFVACDRERLYFAFNCREEHVAKLPNTGSNFVRYDGLLPAGDDLLEILIDPTNAGTGQPADVYHIVIRPTGAVLAKRGIKTGSGWGTVRFWPADVRVAPVLRPDKKTWAVEVSVPLSAFGRQARAGKRWAVNFARYQPRLGEYSSWSGARRYFYNTRTFGNLEWP